MQYRFALKSLLLAFGLALIFSGRLLAADGSERAASPTPPHPKILESAQAPRAARILRQAALNYAPQMSAADRDRDCLQKIALAKRLLDVRRLVELRRETRALLPPGMEPNWEYLRSRRHSNGDRVGVTLIVPAWVPARSQKLQAYAAFEKKWQTVALTTPRKSGFVWFTPKMADINNKTAYRAETIQFEVNSKFAPIAGLLLEYVFREGYYDPARRVPLVTVRGGEDTYAVSDRTAPGAAECLSFPDNDGDSLAAAVVPCSIQNLAELYHGRHAPASNHRLGLAMDLNDINYPGVVDGCPNPVSCSLRQFNRDAMHKLDARQMPSWVFRPAKWLGMRLPQEWTHVNYSTDWQHVDVGTK
ncbi:MAG: hypothetical protein M1438_04000 [Deltaproteobacteria bacterium]|nr:hypothetical protein [Deltaproteobacteria bacterium]